MKTMTKILILSVVGVFLLAGSSWALNIRPVVPGDNDLQNFFDTQVAGETYDAINDQSTAALFEATGTGSVTSFVFSATGSFTYGNGDVFGIYSPISGMMIPVFDLTLIGTNWPNTTINFGDLDFDGQDDDVWITDALGDIDLPGLYHDFGPDAFGYYVTAGGSTYYTEDNKNADGEAWALTYQGHGGTLLMPGGQADVSFDDNHWLTAFEVFSNPGTYKDFDDLIVVAESVDPVPEPATILLLGAGLVGLGYLGRKKKLV